MYRLPDALGVLGEGIGCAKSSDYCSFSVRLDWNTAGTKSFRTCDFKVQMIPKEDMTNALRGRVKMMVVIPSTRSL